MTFPRTLAAALLVFIACSGPSQKTGPDPVPPNPAADPVKPAPAQPAPPAPELKLDADLAAPLAYSAQLEIDPSADTFRGLIAIQVEVKRPTRFLWLNANELEVDKAGLVSADKQRSDIAVTRANDDFITLDLGREINPGRYQLELGYAAKIRGARAFTGVFAQSEEKRDYVYTQFEATGARMAFPCFDQPEFKTPWTLKITAPAGQLAFANTPELKVDKLGDKVAYSFAASKPIPSYLVAFAVGPFEIVDLGTGGRGKIPMRIIVPRGRKDQTAHAAARMKEVLERLEGYFDIGYPYAKLDSIALPQFFGAMENPGLITYAASILLVEPGQETDSFRQVHLNVVAHELAHQWFGNLVTLRWWDDLWLNESFASWMAAKVVEKMRPAWDNDVTRVEVRDDSMSGDALDTARPVRKTITSKNDILGVFDAGITYGKGSSVISMFEAWIGEERFRQGMREYMRTHAWKTTTAADFFASLAKVSDDALPVAFATFIDQSGVPLIAAELECSGKNARLTLRQSRLVPTGSKAAPDSRRWKIPVCAKYGSRGKQYRSCKLIEAEESAIELNAAGRCPDWVVANADSRGYYRVNYGGDLLPKLMRADRQLSTADRIGVIGDVEALMTTGQVKVADALGLIPRLMRDRNHKIVLSAAGIAETISLHVPESMRANYRRFITRTFGRRARQLGWINRPSDSKGTRELREELVPLVALTTKDPRLLRDAGKLARKWIDKPDAIAPDMLEPTLRAAARGGDAALYKAFTLELEEAKDQRQKAAIVAALTEFEDKNLTASSLAMLTGDDLSMRAVFGALQRLLGDPDRRDVTYKFAVDNLGKLAAKLPPMARGFLVYLPVAYCDEAHKADIPKLARKLEDAPGVERAIKSAEEAIDLCIAQRARQRPQITAFLRRY